MKPTSWDHLASELADIEMITEPTQVAKLSQDYHTFSPILQVELSEKTGDLVIPPANKAKWHNPNTEYLLGKARSRASRSRCLTG